MKLLSLKLKNFSGSAVGFDKKTVGSLGPNGVVSPLSTCSRKGYGAKVLFVGYSAA